ncbi:unnamed protein product [Rhizophagus irregularis]|nr:unnamed protein product [Rhizophagus irregularis]
MNEIQRFFWHSGGLPKHRNPKIRRLSGDFRRIEKWKKPSFVGGASEFRRTKKNQDSFGGLPNSEDQKRTKIRQVDFRRIDEPRFFRHSILERWIYGFDFRLGFGYMDFGSWILDIWVSTFGWALDIWVSTFSWALDIWVSYEVSFDFRLGFGYMGSTFGWALDIWISFSSRAFGYIDFDFRFLGFG